MPGSGSWLTDVGYTLGGGGGIAGIVYAIAYLFKRKKMPNERNENGNGGGNILSGKLYKSIEKLIDKIDELNNSIRTAEHQREIQTVKHESRFDRLFDEMSDLKNDVHKLIGSMEKQNRMNELFELQGEVLRGISKNIKKSQ